MTDACLAATVEANPLAAIHLGLPLPTAVGYFGQLGMAARSGGAPLTNSVEAPAVVPPSLSTVDGIDGPFGEVAEAVIRRKMQEAQWDESRAREVRASVALFIHENGDLAFSTVQQHHLFGWTGLMNCLPKRYNHFMVKGQGGFVAALAAAAIIKSSTFEGETAEHKKQCVAKLIGLRSGMRNKHISWLKAIIEGARGAGYTKLSLDFTSLRHGAKQVRKTDKRKKHEKRPNWTVGAYAKLTSGPIYDGCAGIDDLFTPGNIVFQDAVYWAPHVVLKLCGRPGEAALELNDVFEDAPIAYFYVRPNGLRGLKVEGGERMVAIYPRLIELGFLNYVRVLRASHTRLFPEFVHPAGKLDFAWMMRNKILEPAKKLHFPEGTGLEMHGKSPDGHSLRGTGRTALRDAGVEEPMRNYISGHTQGTVGVEVYETPPPLELVMKAVRALDPFFAHLQQRTLHLRPSDRMKFGAKGGRPRERS